MTVITTRARTALLMLALAVLLVPGAAAPAFADGPPVSSVAASYRNGTVTFRGQAQTGVAAVAVLLYSPSGSLLRMTAAEAADDGAFTGTFAVKLTAAGAYTVRASNYDGGPFTAATFKVAASGGSGSGGSAGSGEPATADDQTEPETDLIDDEADPEATATTEPDPATPTPQNDPGVASPADEPAGAGAGSAVLWIWLGGAVLIAVAGSGIAFFRASRVRLPKV